MDDNTAPAAGNFKLRLGHLAPFADTLAGTLADVRLDDGTVILDDVSFGDVAAYVELPAEPLIRDHHAGWKHDADQSGPGYLHAGQILSAFAVGTASTRRSAVMPCHPMRSASSSRWIWLVCRWPIWRRLQPAPR